MLVHTFFFIGRSLAEKKSMGNASSCSASKVIGVEGVVEEYLRPVRAAELMLENPGLFVCDSSWLKVGCRVPGLAAGEELERHRLYFLLPMDMLYSVLTEEEMVTLTYRAAGAARRGGGSKRIGRRMFPVLSEFCLFPADEEEKKVAAAAARTVRAERMERQRSWRPALDTIEEVSCVN